MANEVLFQWISTSYINDIQLDILAVLYLVLLVDVCSFLKEQFNYSFMPILRGHDERCGTILHKGNNEAIGISVHMLPTPIYMNVG